MDLLYITGNEGKFKETKLLIPEIKQLNIDLPEIQEIDPKVIIEKKLIEASKHLQGRFVVDDASFYLDAIPGLPGPLIKWFMKSIGNDGLFNIAKNFNNFGAKASVIVGYMDETKTIRYFDGEIHGRIVEPRGDMGFGWDAIFEPDGFRKTFAEMTSEEKNTISHRKVAINKLKLFLESK